MIESVWLVGPKDYLHYRGLFHIAKSFAQSLDVVCHIGDKPPPNKKILVFCGHILKNVRPGLIIYNSEQISDALFERCKDYLGVLRGAEEVWDYSKLNIENMKGYGINAKLVEVGYSPSMTKSMKPVVKDIDVLFYGSINKRRLQVIDALNEVCKAQILFGIYGDDLDAWLMRSRLVLNMHCFDDVNVFEIFRCSYLLANKIPIVSEVGNDYSLEAGYESGIFFSPYATLVARCLDTLDRMGEAKERATNAFLHFSSRTQKQILREAGII